MDHLIMDIDSIQKQSFVDVLQYRCSLNIRKFHRKTPVLELLLHKVANLSACNFIKKILQHRRFPMKFAKFLKTPFFTEHLRWLVLSVVMLQYSYLLQLKASIIERARRIYYLKCFTYILKINDPAIEPCGDPAFIIFKFIMSNFSR